MAPTSGSASHSVAVGTKRKSSKAAGRGQAKANSRSSRTNQRVSTQGAGHLPAPLSHSHSHLEEGSHQYGSPHQYGTLEAKTSLAGRPPTRDKLGTLGEQLGSKVELVVQTHSDGSTSRGRGTGPVSSSRNSEGVIFGRAVQESSHQHLVSQEYESRGQGSKLLAGAQGPISKKHQTINYSRVEGKGAAKEDFTRVKSTSHAAKAGSSLNKYARELTCKYYNEPSQSRHNFQ
jgi:hypothetical protein